ncbi:MAG: hypothetical protein Kow002_20410 [Anaerolineales bacterium]
MRKVNAQLAQSQAYLQDMIDNAFDLIQSVGADGKILFVNKTWETTLGYTAAEVIGKSIFEFIAEEDRALCQAKMKNIFNGETVQVNFAFVDRDGNEVFVEGHVNCRTENGKAISTRAILRDTTSRQQAEEMLKLSATVFKYINDGIFITDGEGRILMVNKAFTDITGYSQQELQGQRPAVFFPDDKNEKHILKDMHEAIMTTRNWQGEVMTLAKDQRVFPAALKLTTVKQEQGQPNHFIGVLNDITDKIESSGLN